MATLTALLTKARAALDALDDEAALASLLAAWKHSRHPRLADVLDRVSERLTARRPALSMPVKARTARVLELAEQKNDTDLGLLLATPWPGTWKAAVPVMQALAAFDDPRVAMAFCKLVEATPYDTYTSHAFYGPLLAHVAKVGDVRVIPVLEADQQRVKSSYWRQGTRGYIKRALESLKRRPVPLLAKAEEDVLAAVESVFAAKLSASKAARKNEAQYLAEIYAAPGDDHLRAVYADWLTEKGDPRGEFISLQLARERGTASDVALKRERALLNKHEKAWLGERDRVLEKEGREWRRGFLTRAVIEVEYGTREPGPELTDTAWNTLETLSLSWRAANSLGERLLQGPWFAHVRAVRAFPENLVHFLASQPPQPRLRELDFQLDASLTHEARAPLFAAKAFPGVRHLALEGSLDLAARFLDTPLAKQLTRATWVDTGYGLGTWLALIEKAGLKQLEELGSVTAYRQRKGNHWKLTLRRDDAGRFTKLHAEGDLDARVLPHPGGLCQALASLPNDGLTGLSVTRALACDYGQAELALVTTALKRFPKATLDLPWQQLALVETLDGAVPATMTFHGPATRNAAKADAFLEAAGRLQVSFDAWEVDGGKLLALEQPAAGVVSGAFAKKRTREVTVLRKGQTWTGLKFARGFVELSWPFVPGGADVLSWAAETIERTGAESAAASFRTKKGDGWTTRYDLPNLTPHEVGAEWLVTLPPELDARLPFKALTKKSGRAPIEWLHARPLKNGALLLQLGASPAELPTRAQFDALHAVLHESLWQQWKHELGFSPPVWLKENVSPLLKARGFKPVEATAPEEQRGELHFCSRPASGARWVEVKLTEVLSNELAVQVFALHAPGQPDVDFENPSHELDRTMVDGRFLLAKPKGALAELERQLDAQLMPFFEPPPKPAKKRQK